MSDYEISSLIICLPVAGLLSVWWMGGSLRPLRLGMLAVFCGLIFWILIPEIASGFGTSNLKQFIAVGLLLASAGLLCFAQTPIVVWTLFAMSVVLILAMSWYLVFYEFTRLF